MAKMDLIFGDGFSLIKKIPDKSVDLIVTDPPYGINFTKGYKSGSTELIQGDDGFTVMFFLDDILREYKRILKPNSALYIFTRFDVMPYWWIKLKNYFDAKNQIVWFKGGGGMGDLKGNFSYNYESIMFATNGKHKIRGKRDGSVWQIGKCKQEFHETQKPVELIQKIIEHSSDEGMTVFDPFMGSGTTGVACKNLNRNFIGIELNEDYYLTAKKRIENHSPQGGLFLNSFQTELSNEATNPASCQAAVSGSAFSIHDLKCGNILNYDTAEGEILPTVIDWQDLKWLTEDPKGFNLVHSPIPLKEDLLLSFGFVNIGTHLEFKLANNWCLEWYDNILGFSICKGKRGLCLGRIQYVHELQNLHYSLTGVMLSLS